MQLRGANIGPSDAMGMSTANVPTPTAGGRDDIITIGSRRVHRWSDGEGRTFLDLPLDWKLSIITEPGARVRLVDQSGVRIIEGAHKTSVVPWMAEREGVTISRYPMVDDDGVCFAFEMGTTTVEDE